MKTNKFLLIISSVVILASCASRPQYYSYTQICQTTALQKKGIAYNETNRRYEYEDEACIIAYYMFEYAGKITYTITNKTDQILYIDNTRSFLVQNGISYCAAACTPKDKYFEQYMIAPHATISITGPYLKQEDTWLNCDLERSPEPKKPSTVTFDYADSPYNFNSVLCYRLSGSDELHLVDNGFFISRITNYRTSDLSESQTETKENCKNVNGHSNDTKQKYDLFFFKPSNGWATSYTR